jgi:hypothetical protein
MLVQYCYYHNHSFDIKTVVHQSGLLVNRHEAQRVERSHRLTYTGIIRSLYESVVKHGASEAARENTSAEDDAAQPGHDRLSSEAA